MVLSPKVRKFRVTVLPHLSTFSPEPDNHSLASLSLPPSLPYKPSSGRWSGDGRRECVETAWGQWWVECLSGPRDYFDI